MLDAPFAFAFAAGAVAAFNPCGFALLPAYLSYFLGADGDSTARGGGGDAAAAVGRALRVAGAVSVGFAAVFGVAGVAITEASITVQRFTPWISIVIGAALVPLGLALARGWQPNVALPRPARSRGAGRAGDGRGLGAMVWFGASFATVSLSCTIPAFLVAVASTFEQADAASGLAVFGAYTAGMAAVLGTLTVAVALAQGRLVTRMRRLLPYVQQAAGALLAVAGAYVAYYGWYDIRLEQGDSVPTGPVDAVGEWSGIVTRWVDDLGNGPVLVAGGIVLSAGVLLALHRRRAGRAGDPPTPAAPSPPPPTPAASTTPAAPTPAAPTPAASTPAAPAPAAPRSWGP